MSRSFFSRCNGDHTALVVTIFLLAYFLPFTRAQDECDSTKLTCGLPSDQNINYNFRVRGWVTRGGCIRERHANQDCYDILSKLLDCLTSTREAEYAGAASVLSLLPTIGALFGSPTSEIWRLKSIVPFGGALAMSLSFGGALMPVHVEDYEKTVTQRNTAIGSIITLRKQLAGGHKDDQTIDEKLQIISHRVRERIDRHESVKLPKHTLIFGLFIMFILFSMAQAAMAVVEQGGVINWWCSSRWWMHLWYFAVTFTAWTEDRVQRPFIKTYKLYVSSLPYDIETFGGQPTSDYVNSTTTSADAIKQLRTLKPASLNFSGSRLRTRSRNSVMVMVSIVGHNKLDQLWRLLSRSFSVTVFVSGTAIFASVTLLSLIMAVVVLTLTLAAGIFGRAIAGWIVGHVSGTEPMIHVISSDEKEAFQAIGQILCLRSNDGTPFQVEIDGHIFINERRVATRSRLRVSMLGVLAEPYDITKAYEKVATPSSGGFSLNQLSPQQTNTVKGTSSLPFLSDVGEPSLTVNRVDDDALDSQSQQSTRSLSYESNKYFNRQIPRKPIPTVDLER